MIARIRATQQLEKQQQQPEPADAAAAAAAAAVAKDDAQLDDVITGCIGMLVTVHKLTGPAAAGDQQQQQQQGAASIDAALEAALQLLKPKVAANSQAYADIVSSVGRLKAQLARAH
jgi:hypothetical protein